MFRIIRTDSNHIDFIALVKSLDADLKERDGDDHSFYKQFNKITLIKYVVIVYKNETPVGCGAIKEYDPNIMEIKRMYTIPNARGEGVASRILVALEKWTDELSYTSCILETGIRQSEAIKLYEKSGYHKTPNYGQYKGVVYSICFEKLLSKK